MAAPLRVEDNRMTNACQCTLYNLPDVYSTTSTVPSTANLQVVAACSM